MEIGHVEDGKIIIDYPIKHDGNKCLAKEVNNNGRKLKWVKKGKLSKFLDMFSLFCIFETG